MLTDGLVICGHRIGCGIKGTVGLFLHLIQHICRRTFEGIAVCVLTVVPCPGPDASDQFETVKQFPFCRQGTCQFVIDRLDISALLYALETVGITSCRICVCPVRILYLIDRRHTVGLLHDPVGLIGMVGDGVARKLRGQVDCQPVRYLMAEIQTGIETFVAVVFGPLEHTVLVKEADGCHI